MPRTPLFDLTSMLDLFDFLLGYTSKEMNTSHSFCSASFFQYLWPLRFLFFCLLECHLPDCQSSGVASSGSAGGGAGKGDNLRPLARGYRMRCTSPGVHIRRKRAHPHQSTHPPAHVCTQARTCVHVHVHTHTYAYTTHTTYTRVIMHNTGTHLNTLLTPTQNTKAQNMCSTKHTHTNK